MKRGCQDGLAKAEEDSKKKFSFVDGFKGVWRSPSQKAQDEAQKLLAKAKKKQVRAEEEARKAKVQADNRVTAVAQQLQLEQARTKQLEKELLDKEQKIKELTPIHSQEQRKNFKKNIFLCILQFGIFSVVFFFSAQIHHDATNENYWSRHICYIYSNI